MPERLVILGAGESGLGTAVLAKQQGYEVFVSDGGQIKDGYRSELQLNQIDFEEAQTLFIIIRDFILKMLFVQNII